MSETGWSLHPQLRADTAFVCDLPLSRLLAMRLRRGDLGEGAHWVSGLALKARNPPDEPADCLE